ncbi:hypothetical protein [Paenibacillus macerans]|nr:hypothetical protein [Paenibacillus macerans]
MMPKVKQGHGEKKSRKKELAALALITERTIGEAAGKAGIGEATLWRWMQEDGFQELWREMKRQAVGRAISKIQQSATMAVETLEDVMGNRKAPAMARVMAAKTVLDTALKAVEIEDLTARLEALERSANDEPKSGRASS